MPPLPIHALAISVTVNLSIGYRMQGECEFIWVDEKISWWCCVDGKLHYEESCLSEVCLLMQPTTSQHCLSLSETQDG
jgi:hypothetical protein